MTRYGTVCYKVNHNRKAELKKKKQELVTTAVHHAFGTLAGRLFLQIHPPRVVFIFYEGQKQFFVFLIEVSPVIQTFLFSKNVVNFFPAESSTGRI